MRWPVLAAVALMVACDGQYLMPPPARFQGNGRFVVVTHVAEEMPQVCAGAITVGEGQGTLIGCFKDGVIHMPAPFINPLMACQVEAHEMGHALGWPATHPR